MDWGVSLDGTSFSLTLPSNQLRLVLWAWGDQMGFFVADDAAVDAARALAAEDRMRRVDSVPYGARAEIVRRELYAVGHPYRTAPMGVPDRPSQATAADVRAFHARWYVPGNATLVLVGDLRPDEALAEVERYFGPIPSAAIPDLPKTAPAPVRHVQVGVAANVEHDLVSVSWLVAPARRPDARLEQLAETLGGSVTRVLEWELEHKQQVATRAHASYSPRELGSIFQIDVTVAPGHGAAEVLSALEALLATLGTGPLQASAVERASLTLAADRDRAAETMLGRARRFVVPGLERADPATTAETLSRVLATQVLAQPSVAILFTRDPAAPLAGEVRSRTERPAP
jgi:zinc protease